MKTEMVEITKLKPSEYNPRKISKSEMLKLKESIKQFGFVEPIIVNKHTGRENYIIGGHQRLEAAKELGIKEVPVSYVDLTEDKEKLLNLALNRISGTWDDKLLKIVLKELDEGNADIYLSGFTDFELNRILGERWEGVEEISEQGLTKVNKGDIWQLGNHRIMCGDATKKEDIDKLIGKQIIDLVLTDPPYNLGYKYHSYKDNKKPEEYKAWCETWFNICKELSDKILITTGPQNIAMWCSIEQPKWIMAWFKKNANSGCALRGFNKWEPIAIYGKFEPVVFFGNIDKIIPWDVITDAEFDKIEDVYNIRTAFLEDRDEVGAIHTCPKPVKLWFRLINDFTRTENSVLDIFLGSGTALIACEKAKRICLGMEMDPHYVAVSIKRWEAYTGKKAVKLDN